MKLSPYFYWLYQTAELLVYWNNLPPKNATWESYEELKTREELFFFFLNRGGEGKEHGDLLGRVVVRGGKRGMGTTPFPLHLYIAPPPDLLEAHTLWVFNGALTSLLPVLNRGGKKRVKGKKRVVGAFASSSSRSRITHPSTTLAQSTTSFYTVSSKEHLVERKMTEVESSNHKLPPQPQLNGESAFSKLPRAGEDWPRPCVQNTEKATLSVRAEDSVQEELQKRQPQFLLFVPSREKLPQSVTMKQPRPYFSLSPHSLFCSHAQTLLQHSSLQRFSLKFCSPWVQNTLFKKNCRKGSPNSYSSSTAQQPHLFSPSRPLANPDLQPKVGRNRPSIAFNPESVQPRRPLFTDLLLCSPILKRRNRGKVGAQQPRSFTTGRKEIEGEKGRKRKDKKKKERRGEGAVLWRRREKEEKKRKKKMEEAGGNRSLCVDGGEGKERKKKRKEEMWKEGRLKEEEEERKKGLRGEEREEERRRKRAAAMAADGKRNEGCGCGCGGSWERRRGKKKKRKRRGRRTGEEEEAAAVAAATAGEEEGAMAERGAEIVVEGTVVVAVAKVGKKRK
ncbi:hypothetical protein MUK42_27850 [Musa troglodytarum]|uniref:Uncharacterized protein n=1 Tax=Musa troglodytarum TaxID=320322 RepID=A0A9E7GED8_9LILI|nr:hypothetical protein MUK42_27850 [Musa troglodytarum]